MESLSLWVQLLASFTTIASVYLYGSKSLWGPRLALVSQAFWWTIMFTAGLWGLLPLNAVMAIMHIRNLLKWRAEARTLKGRADAQRETVRAGPEHPGAVQGHHPKRRTAKAYEVLAGGQLR